MARVREGSRLRAKLIMCGDGPERDDAEILAERLGVAQCVEFVGKQPQSQIRDYLSVADLLLLPSLTESFGLAALEAMACEVPVIATRVGGLPEVVEDGECGYLFGVGDVQGMAERAIEILSDAGLRRAIGPPWARDSRLAFHHGKDNPAVRSSLPECARKGEG